MRTLDCLINKQIAIVGLGITGRSTIRYLQKKQSQLNIRLCAMDSREALVLPEAEFDNIPVALGRFDMRMLAESEVWIVSPGIALTMPEIAQSKQANTLILGDIELFALFNQAQHNHIKVAAVTGSNGKSTVVTLMHDMAQAADMEVVLAGNIGMPILDVLDRVERQNKSDILMVIELSSFQLETTESLAADIACILNISEDHLDRYPDFDRYCEAKQRIYHNAKTAVYWREDEKTHPTKHASEKLRKLSLSNQPQKSGFGITSDARSSDKTMTWDGERYLCASELLLFGDHNLLNVQAAAVMLREFGVSDEIIVSVAQQFSGLPHRCQHVAKKSGATWINDSKATNVAATIAAITGIRDAISGRLILIAGGDSKGADLSPLVPVLRRDVDEIIVLGKDASLIKVLCANAHQVSNLNRAVVLAAGFTEKRIGEENVVLLSPACASLDMFKNYQHRGEQFVRAVEGLDA